MNRNMPIFLPSVSPLAEKEFPTELLFYWQACPKTPMLASQDPLVLSFISAAMKGDQISFFYLEGTTPGRRRRVSPALVFQNEPEGFVYVLGFCHERQANRVFRVDRIMPVCIVN